MSVFRGCPPDVILYVVQPGDSLFSIGQQFSVGLAAMIAANPLIRDPNVIFPGQIVCIPGRLLPIDPPLDPPAPTNDPGMVG